MVSREGGGRRSTPFGNWEPDPSIDWNCCSVKDLRGSHPVGTGGRGCWGSTARTAEGGAALDSPDVGGRQQPGSGASPEGAEVDLAVGLYPREDVGHEPPWSGWIEQAPRGGTGSAVIGDDLLRRGTAPGSRPRAVRWVPIRPGRRGRAEKSG